MSLRGDTRSGGDTRATLVDAARELFAERGYAAVGTEEIVSKAKVTRGALYHHFRDKRDLFRAALEDVERELTEGIASELEGIQDPGELLTAGIRSFLDACGDPAFIQIALTDGPGVLGWAELREIDARYGLGLVSLALAGAMEAGLIPRQELRPLAHLMLAALGEAAFLVANAPDRTAARDEMERTLLALVGLRA